MRIQLASGNFCEVQFKDNEKRNLLLILPGGGYSYTSTREAVPVQNAFADLNIHSAIFYYREERLIYPEILEEAVLLLNKLSALPQIDKIMIIGFSAGGHYAGMLLTRFSYFFSKGLLIYPVISTLPEYIHKESYDMLLGENFKSGDLSELSVDLLVHEKVPPVFLMHCVDDPSVPVDNSMIMMRALKSKGVYVEAHFYPTGGHGISVDTEEVVQTKYDTRAFIKEFGYVSSWVDLAKGFINRDI